MWGMRSGLDQRRRVIAAQLSHPQVHYILEKRVGLTLLAGGHEKESGGVQTAINHILAETLRISTRRWEKNRGQHTCPDRCYLMFSLSL